MASNAVLIRGLDRTVYNRIVAKAKEQGKNVAELVNEALRSYLGSEPAQHNVFDTKKLVIAGTVMLSKQDILGLHDELGPFHLENSGEITFENDVDRDTMHRIGGIQNTGKLRVPAAIHPHVLIKTGRVNGEIEKY